MYDSTTNEGKASQKIGKIRKISLTGGPPLPPLSTFRNPNATLVHQNPRFYLRFPPPKTKEVLKPTVSRESVCNHSIKKWSDQTSPFHLNDNMICFIAILLFLVQKMVIISTKNLGLLAGVYILRYSHIFIFIKNFHF